MDQEELLHSIRSGDDGAFLTLVNLYRHKVINTCFRFLLSKEDAEDVSQEVFVEVFRSIKEFRGQSGLSTWIYRITVSKCLDEIKKRNRKKRISSIGKMLHIDDVANWISGHQQADRKLILSENMQQLYDVLNTLPENQRVAFTLSKIEGFTAAEIAAILLTTTDAVDALIARAKKNAGDAMKTILKNSDNP